jgi:UDP-galactopyranose mutase
MYDYLIVGAGFAGCVIAERLASQRNSKVLLVEKREHIGGNAYDSTNEHGIRVHHYGPHLFHTNSEAVSGYLSQFTEWRPYEHRVRSSVGGVLVPFPINRDTVNMLLGTDLRTDADVERFFATEREAVDTVRNSRDFVISRVGIRLHDLLYEGYSSKHWGVSSAMLSPNVCGRVPIRTNTDDRYFEDSFQAIPLHGYTAMFERMLEHPNIDVELGQDYAALRGVTFNRLVYTGPIDAFFGYSYGRLPYRSLRFDFETFDTELVQPVAQINYPNDNPYTRTVEFKHITGQRHPMTTISREYPAYVGEPYYPVPNDENFALYRKYRDAADGLPAVYFAGRLASYKYLNMDQVVAQALHLYHLLP